MGWHCQFDPVCIGTVPEQIDALPEIAGKGTIVVFLLLFGLTLLNMLLIAAIDTYDYTRNGRNPFVRNYQSKNRTTYMRKILETLLEDLTKLQLAMGFAILIVGFHRACYLSVYHWNIISYMAILSATLQTASFFVLAREWQRCLWVLYARRFLVACIFVLLASFIIMKDWTKGWSFANDGDARWPALCFFQPDKKGPALDQPKNFGWASSEILIVPWMAFAFEGIHPEMYNAIRDETTRNIILGALHVAIPLFVSFFSAKQLWLARKSFSDHHYLRNSYDDTWDFGQIVTLVLILGTAVDLIQIWNKEHVARRGRREGVGQW